jgi:hypothetical protein
VELRGVVVNLSDVLEPVAKTSFRSLRVVRGSSLTRA